MTQIPIYRAKKIDSDKYFVGYLKITKYNSRTEYVINFSYDSSSIFGECEIDPSTLAIHFPDMLDSQGNKIFASLSEDGKGGDCISMDNGYNETFCWDNLNACIVLKSKHYECRLFKAYNSKEPTFNKYTILGIQQ